VWPSIVSAGLESIYLIVELGTAGHEPMIRQRRKLGVAGSYNLQSRWPGASLLRKCGEMTAALVVQLGEEEQWKGARRSGAEDVVEKNESWGTVLCPEREESSARDSCMTKPCRVAL
jgi:hypothetical protein